MKIRFNYYLKIKNIMGKDFDIFNVPESMSLKKIILTNISKEKIDKIDLSEILIVSDGRNIENLDEIVEEDAVFSVCPKIYGG